jgi:cbb3-type cytochrome oxidase cytochrome c subunit
VRLKVVVIVVVLAAAGLAARYFLTEPDGAELFGREGCVKCHVFKDRGMGKINLNEVCRRHSAAWMHDQITNARLHREDSGMPSFGFLSDRQIEALISYLRQPCRGR